MLVGVEENPYAPSKADPIMEAPAAHGWELHEGQLRVESGAILPMVDLYSGEIAETMTLMRIAVRRRSRWPLYLLIVGFAMLAIPGGSENATVFFSLGVVGLVARSVGMVFSPAAYIQIFLTKGTRRRQLRHRLRVLILAGGAFGVAIAAGFLDRTAPAARGVAPVMLGVFSLLLLAALVMWLRREVLYYGERSRGFFRVRGIHPEALRALEEIMGRSSKA
ncbi:hypothetical protein [Haloferula sp. BvORR071]|uniref:hypothetical protein n=1 Tax=Haloferula sp. BvORR071 TaxID=1396141 RepID=UPI00054EF01F|nr:hypothetical protein [Haloferula sp. BvORR071]